MIPLSIRSGPVQQTGWMNVRNLSRPNGAPGPIGNCINTLGDRTLRGAYSFVRNTLLYRVIVRYHTWYQIITNENQWTASFKMESSDRKKPLYIDSTKLQTQRHELWFMIIEIIIKHTLSLPEVNRTWVSTDIANEVTAEKCLSNTEIHFFLFKSQTLTVASSLPETSCSIKVIQTLAIDHLTVKGIKYWTHMLNIGIRMENHAGDDSFVTFKEMCTESTINIPHLYCPICTSSSKQTPRRMARHYHHWTFVTLKSEIKKKKINNATMINRREQKKTKNLIDSHFPRADALKWLEIPNPNQPTMTGRE